MQVCDVDVAVVGSGSCGIATAYYLARQHGIRNLALIDTDQPMSFTSAQSGENYRNWWPHPSMVNFTNRSIDLLEDIASASGNRINMTRRGYALSTRRTDITDLIEELHQGLGEQAAQLLRYHAPGSNSTYETAADADWRRAPTGVDVLSDTTRIAQAFPSYQSDIKAVVHIRRGGDISAQQLGAYMLEYLKENGTQRQRGTVISIESDDRYTLEIRTDTGTRLTRAEKIVNCAGPFAGELANLMGVSLPVYNTFQQKIAFEDTQRCIPRTMPFSIDLDNQHIDWTAEERELLNEDAATRWLTEDMPGAIHCRPDGGDHGSWVKLGWAYNQARANASRDLPLDPSFPEIVLHGAARLNASLKKYYGTLPRNHHHYGGWYTMTDENWPLIGPMGPEGTFMNCAQSGFGTMCACASGELCAAWVADAELPDYAHDFSLHRYDNDALMTSLRRANRGIL